ncbi:leucyl aminopeptidase [Natronoglycomyces albus]|uniref:Probable cytosol aminopeptidase n=1 Tax=Natronoglycomyces albus TaxID=2811108 RepID=A0A895XSX2_9ACTN|nr:leucyl aminopeptidase [Natronoglycomyces albus]QSB06355.1 leucyl aminopeptidase [Natronoglycomyces albus]
MTQLKAAATSAADIEVDVLVVGLVAGDDAPELVGAAEVNSAFDDLAGTFQLLGNEGKASSVTFLPSQGNVAAKLILGVGLGKANDEGDFEAETLRRAAGEAVRASFGHATVAFALPGDTEAIATGALLGAYQAKTYKTDTDDIKLPPEAVTVLGADAATLTRVHGLAAGVFATRDWVNQPGNYLRPPSFADDIAHKSRAVGLEVDILDETALQEAGYGGILAVGMGSTEKPRLVKITYRAEGASKHVAFVGKGITFDTGGISLKPSQGMWDMKGDMGGAAAVCGAMLAIAEVKPNVNVTAWVALAENMPSGDAYRPGDVVTTYSGKTVEVLNTDAEGRMVLCDALWRAAEDSPDAIYDVATLTGGQVIALGARCAGVMGDEEETARIKRVGDSVGEMMWPMPIPEDIKKNMSSTIADVVQVARGMKRDGHMLQGGHFLSKFLPEGQAWAHIDIAGPSDGPDAYGYVPAGGSGIPVRTLVGLVEDFQS